MRTLLTMAIFCLGNFSSIQADAAGPGNGMRDGFCIYRHNGSEYDSSLPVDGKCPTAKTPPGEGVHKILELTATPVLNASALFPDVVMIDTHGCKVTVEHLPGGDPNL